MDTNMALLSTGTGGTLLGILYMLYRTLNHKRCRSNCLGRNLELSIDIENTTPPSQSKDKFEKENPIRVQIKE
jgi:hypothetical protein